MKKFFGTLFALYWGINATAQVGINTVTPDKSSMLEIYATDSGILIPRIYLSGLNDRTTIKNGNVVSLMVFNTNPSMGQGYYYWSGTNWVKLLATNDAKNYTAENGITIKGTEMTLGGLLNRPTTITTSAQHTLAIEGVAKNNVQQQSETLLALDQSNVIKALKAAMPKFFYMPSIVIPTHTDQLAAGEVFGTINLYEKYQNQFGAPMRRNSSATTALPVLPKNEIDYYITWYDTNVFDSVQVTNDGVLTYSIKANADVTIASFMNIVFAIKP